MAHSPGHTFEHCDSLCGRVKTDKPPPRGPSVSPLPPAQSFSYCPAHAQVRNNGAGPRPHSTPRRRPPASSQHKQGPRKSASANFRAEAEISASGSVFSKARAARGTRRGSYSERERFHLMLRIAQIEGRTLLGEM